MARASHRLLASARHVPSGTSPPAYLPSSPVVHQLLFEMRARFSCCRDRDDLLSQAELQNPQARHPTHAKPEMLKYADASAASSPRDAVQTRGIVGARKMSMYGDATKVNMSYKNMIKQVGSHMRALTNLCGEQNRGGLETVFLWEGGGGEVRVSRPRIEMARR